MVVLTDKTPTKVSGTPGSRSPASGSTPSPRKEAARSAAKKRLCYDNANDDDQGRLKAADTGDPFSLSNLETPKSPTIKVHSNDTNGGRSALKKRKIEEAREWDTMNTINASKKNKENVNFAKQDRTPPSVTKVRTRHFGDVIIPSSSNHQLQDANGNNNADDVDEEVSFNFNPKPNVNVNLNLTF